MKKIFIILLPLLLINGCGGSDNNANDRTAFTLAKNSASLGNPRSPNDLSSAMLLQKKDYRFAWHHILFPIASAIELVQNVLFNGINEPTEGTFSQTTLDELNADYASELALFQDDANNGSAFNYNDLLQKGVSSVTYASAGHIAYGLIWQLWLAELDLRRQVYNEVLIVSQIDTPSGTFAAVPIPATLTTQSSTYSVSEASGTASYFIGWAENTNTLAIRSAFNQIENNFTAHESVESVVSTNSIAIVISKTGTPTNSSDISPYKVILTGTKDVSNTIEIAARLYRPGWLANIKTQVATNTGMGYIVIKAKAQQQGTNFLMRVDYGQCATTETSCSVISGAITGTITHNISGSLGSSSNLNTSGATTTAITAPSLDVPDFWTNATTTFRLRF